MTSFLADPIAREHDPGPGHKEQPARWDAAVRGLGEFKLTERKPRAANREEMLLCHTAEYLSLAEREVGEGRAILSTGDTEICARSFEVARHAAGVCLDAVDLVASGGGGGNAFCIVRPPGHHATADRGMGFCLLNNVALTARYAQRHYGVGRVLIADWDVHHGNGTQDIFYGDRSVFFFSTHQSPWYPGTGSHDETGSGAGHGTTMNRPFAAGAGREEILGAFRELVREMNQFRPELVLVSAGFDSRLGDPLGQFRLSDEDFAELTRMLMEVADQHAGGRLISVLEGGYLLEGLTQGVRSHTRTLAGLSG